LKAYYLLNIKKGVLGLKKLSSLLFGFLLILLLAACNGTTESVDQTETKESAETTEETKKEPLTLEEVFAKTTEASADLKSFAMDMNLVQDITSDVEEANLTLESSTFMEVVADPIAFYQKMEMTIPDASETIKTESYFSKDGFYMHDPTSATWMKFPAEMTDQLVQLSGQQTNPADEIKKLEEFSEDVSFEEKENGYALALTASGEEFTELIQETIEQTLPQEMAGNEDVMQNLKIHSVVYDILIDKETFYPKTMNVNMEMEITIEDQTVKLSQQMEGEYSKHNSIDEIVIPAEVLETAEEMPM